jgi:hypothetical protein
VEGVVTYSLTQLVERRFTEHEALRRAAAETARAAILTALTNDAAARTPKVAERIAARLSAKMAAGNWTWQTADAVVTDINDEEARAAEDRGEWSWEITPSQVDQAVAAIDRRVYAATGRRLERAHGYGMPCPGCVDAPKSAAQERESGRVNDGWLTTLQLFVAVSSPVLTIRRQARKELRWRLSRILAGKRFGRAS